MGESLAAFAGRSAPSRRRAGVFAGRSDTRARTSASVGSRWRVLGNGELDRPHRARPAPALRTRLRPRPHCGQRLGWRSCMPASDGRIPLRLGIETDRAAADPQVRALARCPASRDLSRRAGAGAPVAGHPPQSPPVSAVDVTRASSRSRRRRDYASGLGRRLARAVSPLQRGLTGSNALRPLNSRRCARGGSPSVVRPPSS